MDNKKEALLEAILNYIEDHIKIEDENDRNWGFKGIRFKDFSELDLLKFIYYICPGIFNSLALSAKNDKKEEN